jgi:hypothetical protein
VFVFYTLPSLVRVPSVVFSQSVSQHPAARQAFCGCAGEENTLNRALSSGPRGVQGLQWVRTGLSDHLRGLQLGQRALGTQAGGGGCSVDPTSYSQYRPLHYACRSSRCLTRGVLWRSWPFRIQFVLQAVPLICVQPGIYRAHIRPLGAFLACYRASGSPTVDMYTTGWPLSSISCAR